MFLQDTRIIQEHGPHGVHAQRCEVMFRDGSSVHLHPVVLDGTPSTFLRALQTEGLRWHIVDVRHFGPDVERDILGLLPRDAHGVVFYTLRLKYPSAAAFLAELAQYTLRGWWQEPAPSIGARLALA